MLLSAWEFKDDKRPYIKNIWKHIDEQGEVRNIGIKYVN